MTRILSGVVIVAGVLATVWYAPGWLFLAAVELVLVGAFLEYAGLVARAGLTVPKAVGATAAAVMAAAIGIPGVPVLYVLATVVIAACLVVLGLHRPGTDVPGSVAATLFPVMYLGLPLGMLAAVRAEHGREAVLFVIIVVAASDTAQFYAGTWLGRHRLAPAVSPKKSVEGAVAGLATGAAVTAYFGALVWPALGPGPLAALGVVMAALGIAGDLFESLLKRSADVKDSSGLIPGHGGILDRIDALLLVVPGYYVFLYSLK